MRWANQPRGAPSNTVPRATPINKLFSKSRRWIRVRSCLDSGITIGVFRIVASSKNSSYQICKRDPLPLSSCRSRLTARGRAFKTCSQSTCIRIYSAINDTFYLIDGFRRILPRLFSVFASFLDRLDNAVIVGIVRVGALIVSTSRPKIVQKHSLHELNNRDGFRLYTLNTKQLPQAIVP